MGFGSFEASIRAYSFKPGKELRDVIDAESYNTVISNDDSSGKGILYVHL